MNQIKQRIAKRIKKLASLAKKLEKIHKAPVIDRENPTGNPHLARRADLCNRP